MRKIAVYRSLISYLVPELQSFEDAGKSIEINQNQSKLIKYVTSHTLLEDLMNN